jgi:hypothetical protein
MVASNLVLDTAPTNGSVRRWQVAAAPVAGGVIPEDLPKVYQRAEVHVAPPDVLKASDLSDFAFCPTKWALKELDQVEARPRQIKVSQGKEPLRTESSRKALDVAVGTRKALGGKDESSKPVLLPVGEYAEDIAANVTAANDWPVTAGGSVSSVRVQSGIDTALGPFDVFVSADRFEGVNGGVLSTLKFGEPPKDDADDAAEGNVKDFRDLALTAHALSSQHGHPVRHLALRYPHGQREVTVDLQSEFGKHVMNSALNYLADVGDDIEEACDTGQFEAKPSVNKCNRCEQAHACSFNAQPEE